MTTLLKHEFLRTRGFLGVMFGGALLVAGVGVLFALTGLPGVSLVGTVLAYAAPIVLVSVMPLVLGIDYWRASYGRVGYFTQTLPIRGDHIFTAKLVWSMLVVLASVVWAAALLLGGGFALTPGFGAMVTEALDVMAAVAPPWLVVVGIVGFAWLLVSTPAQFFFAASIGSEARFSRLGAAAGPIIVYVVVYLVYQALVMAGIFLLPWGIGPTEAGDLGILSVTFTELLGRDDVMPLGFIPPMLVLPLLFMGRTGVSWRSRVSLA